MISNEDRHHRLFYNVISCKCPGSKPGKINIDASAHLPDCWIRKRLSTKRYTTDTSITPKQSDNSYRLGVAIRVD